MDALIRHRVMPGVCKEARALEDDIVRLGTVNSEELEHKMLITGFLAEYCGACCADVIRIIARYLVEAVFPPICIIKGSHNHLRSGYTSREMVNLNTRSSTNFRLFPALRGCDYTDLALTNECTLRDRHWDRQHSALCFVDSFDCASLIPQDTLSQMQRAHGNVFNPSP